MAAYVSGERRNFDRDAPAGAGSGEFDIRRHARLGALGFERQERFRRTPNENAYAYAPLTDTSDNVISVALSGLQTLRLTGSEVTPGMQADLLMLVPTEPRYRLNISFSGGQVTLSFQTRTGLTYTLQYRNALSDTVWQNPLPAINGDGNTHSVNQPASQVSRFYRLSVH